MIFLSVISSNVKYCEFLFILMINTNSTSYDFLYFAQICFDGRFMYTFIGSSTAGSQ